MPGRPARLSMKLGWYLFQQKLKGAHALPADDDPRAARGV